MPGLFLAAQSLQIYFVKPLQQQAIMAAPVGGAMHAIIVAQER
jgi:hypothetical protein